MFAEIVKVAVFQSPILVWNFEMDLAAMKVAFPSIQVFDLANDEQIMAAVKLHSLYKNYINENTLRIQLPEVSL